MRVLRVLGVVGLVLAAAGCGGRSSVDRTAPSPCETRVAAKNPADTLTVVLFDKVDLAHAPWGQNREERFVFSHLYETLITIDCRGEIRPGLAKSWHRSSDGWLIELREDAEFWDESPVTAMDVVASFQPAIRNGIAIGSVDALNDREVLISRYGGDVDLKLFALQMLSVTRKPDANGIPIGTGPWEIVDPLGPTLTMRPVAREVPVVRFVERNVRDARDLFDGGADAMITDDPAAIEYAAAKQGEMLFPLAWDRAYFLISRWRLIRVLNGKPAGDLPAALREEFARNVVQKDARGGSSFMADSREACGFSAPQDTVPNEPIEDLFGHAVPLKVVFNAADPVARSLAERIVALAAMDTSTSADARAVIQAVAELGLPSVRATESPPEDFARDLQKGGAGAYVFSLSWCSDFPFIVRWFDEHTWLTRRSDVASRSVLPLVETRAHFIAISDRIGFAHDGAGHLRITNPAMEPSP